MGLLKIRTQLTLGVVAVLLCGTTSNTHLIAQGGTPIGNPYAAVKLVYAIPQDRAYRADYAMAIENAELNIRAFYASQLGGLTFTFFRHQSPIVETCKLPQNADYYLTDSAAKLLLDIQSCWAVSGAPRSPHTWVVFTDLEHGCHAPGTLESVETGVVVFSSASVHGLVGERTADDCGVESVHPYNWWVGALAHEIGHAFGLPGFYGCNPAAPDDRCYGLMGDGWALYPNTYLRDEEKVALRALPVFNGPRPRPADPTDFDGDGRTDIGVFRPSTGNWYVRYAKTGTGLTFLWGGAGDVPTAGDYDGDGLSDIAIFRPSNGTWYVRYTASGALLNFAWGGVGDKAVQGDYDGDGKTDMAIFRPSTGTWYIRNTATGTGLTVVWGGAGDVPVAGDFDGDGKTDVAIFRPSTGTWYVRYTATGAGVTLVWGGAGDVPAAADYDGDGKADIAIFRASTGTWFLRYASGSGLSVVFGGGTDVPAPGDYDGDGLMDIAIFRPSTGTWFIRFSNNGAGTSSVWGGAGDIPVLGRP